MQKFHHFRRSLLVASALLLSLIGPAAGEDDTFQKHILPLVDHYCFRCHGEGEKLKGDVDLTLFKNEASIIAERKLWLEVLHQIKTEEMPTKEPLPSREERREMVAWLDKKLNDIDWSKIRDAGHVTIPRLNKVEYNNTMRDLLGADVRPGDRFLDDGEGQSGFTTDRDNLFTTPAQMEKYFAAAERALDAIAALDAEPTKRRFESEKMFMTETREKPKAFGRGFFGYALNRGQMTLYDSIDFPYDGQYTFTVRARAASGDIAGGRLRINDEVMGDILVPAEPTLAKVTCFVPRGTHQVAWNIENPKVPKSKLPPGLAQVAPAKSSKKYKKLPEDAAEIVEGKSAANAPKFPRDAGVQPERVVAAIDQFDRIYRSAQLSYEWLRLHGKDGDPAQLKLYIDRARGLSRRTNSTLSSLAKALKEDRKKTKERFERANRDRLADNAKLLKEATAMVAAADQKPKPKAKPKEKPGSLAIDWFEISGPERPAGAPSTPIVFFTRPGGGVSEEDAARRIVSLFVQRAFRRAVTPEEIERYLGIYQKAKAGGQDYNSSIKLALNGALVSPHFLFRHELAPETDGAGEFALDDFQIASRLSYFLWMSMPDDELFTLAAKGKLREPETLRAQVRRMLKDPKSRSFTTSFLGQWLGFESLGTSVMPDAKLFPEFDVELAEAMKMETILTFEQLLQNGNSLTMLLDSKATFLNEKLANHYGIEDIEGAQMRPVSLADRSRGGLLGMGSVLTSTSSPTRTSPVMRGKWVVETLLGDRIPDPPPDAGQLDANAGKKRGKTLREELELHRNKPDCASCHDKIDPIGFGLENFDAIGRYRAKENGKPIDSSGALDGFEFSGAAELKAWLLAEREAEFTRNVTERMLAFSLGRELQTFDEAPILKILAALEANETSATTLVEEIVLSYPFLHQNNSPAEEVK